MMRKLSVNKGMSRPAKTALQVKKVAPPAVPEIYRHSGSSFGSAGYASSEDGGNVSVGTPHHTQHHQQTQQSQPDTPSAISLQDDHSDYGGSTISKSPGILCMGNTPNIGGGGGNSNSNYMSANTFTFPVPRGEPLTHKAAVLYHQQLALQEDQGIDLTQSPGRDSPGSSSGSAGSGSRHSTASLDSGRASSYLTSVSTSNRSGISGNAGSGVTGNNGGVVVGNNTTNSSGSTGSGSCNLSSPRCSVSSCSLGSVDRISAQRTDYDLINDWLSDIQLDEYAHLFVTAGYDLQTITRMTPEDLTAIGIKKPHHREKIKQSIDVLQLPDSLPNYVPGSIEEWLGLLRLEEYVQQLLSQGYKTVRDVTQLIWDDLEDIGIVKLGHQKKILLAIKRVKDIISGKVVVPAIGGSSQQQHHVFHQQYLPQQHHMHTMQQHHHHHHQPSQHVQQPYWRNDLPSPSHHHHNNYHYQPLYSNESNWEDAMVDDLNGVCVDARDISNTSCDMMGGGGTGGGVVCGGGNDLYMRNNSLQKPKHQVLMPHKVQLSDSSSYYLQQHQLQHSQHSHSKEQQDANDIVLIKLRQPRGKSLESLEDPNERNNDRNSSQHSNFSRASDVFYCHLDGAVTICDQYSNVNTPWRRSYDDGDITPTNEINLNCCHDQGGGTLPRHRGSSIGSCNSNNLMNNQFYRQRPIVKMLANNLIQNPQPPNPRGVVGSNNSNVIGQQSINYSGHNNNLIINSNNSSLMNNKIKNQVPPEPPQRHQKQMLQASSVNNGGGGNGIGATGIAPNSNNCDNIIIDQISNHFTDAMQLSSPQTNFVSSGVVSSQSVMITQQQFYSHQQQQQQQHQQQYQNLQQPIQYNYYHQQQQQQQQQLHPHSHFNHHSQQQQNPQLIYVNYAGQQHQTTVEIHSEISHDLKSNSSIDSIDALPFANENAGTLKQRALNRTDMNLQQQLQQSHPQQASTLSLSSSSSTSSTSSSSASITTTIALGLQSVAAVTSTPNTTSSQLRQQSEVIADTNVLNDIGNMLANLTDELDAMLEEEKRVGLNDSE